MLAHAWNHEHVQRAQLEQAAHAEREGVTVRDKFDPHGLPPDVLTQLRDALKSIPGLRRVYLVRKRVKHFAHRPLFILGFGVTGVLRPHSKSRAVRVLNLIQERVSFPGETMILNVEGDNYRFGRKLRWKRGARIV
ncbi:hypothetical protein HUS23_02695 [Ectothiorhodospiraceae bacterium 2226]|nr:hypothetical protein HUS23_02695 [Ectothiorhodospiraceae bacterium 2226]